MRVVVQRVSQSSVIIESDIVSSISKGLLILLGVENNDTLDDVNWLIRKIINLRIFTDIDGKMNNSIIDIKGDIIVVSQFTLHAKTKKGNRPSYINAAPPKIAIPLYENFVQVLKNESKLNVFTGEFGADMKVSLINDGPVTIIIDSKNRDF
ncbi:MAG: D-aminoacyl-tRNA deacylase [Flavobacteriales bacterium]|tara:strand:+ start:238 stop:693 length:456 start_codon:yes stop_codon:yes gene_type:complete